MEAQIWREAKGELRDAAGELLQRAGFSAEDIAGANYEQRVKLLEELGQKDLLTTSSGRPSKIDAVPVEARARTVQAVDFDLAATCGNSALDPLSMPSLDAYQKMDLAEVIRSTKVE